MCSDWARATDRMRSTRLTKTPWYVLICCAWYSVTNKGLRSSRSTEQLISVLLKAFDSSTLRRYQGRPRKDLDRATRSKRRKGTCTRRVGSGMTLGTGTAVVEAQRSQSYACKDGVKYTKIAAPPARCRRLLFLNLQIQAFPNLHTLPPPFLLPLPSSPHF